MSFLDILNNSMNNKNKNGDMLIYNIQTFSHNVTILTKLISKIGTSLDNENIRTTIEDLINKTILLMNDIKREFGESISKEKRINMMKISDDFQVWIQKFQDNLKSYRNKIEIFCVPTSE